MEKTVSGITRTGHSNKYSSKPRKIKIIKTNNFTSMSKEEAEFRDFRKKYYYLDEELAKERFQQGWR